MLGKKGMCITRYAASFITNMKTKSLMYLPLCIVNDLLDRFRVSKKFKSENNGMEYETVESIALVLFSAHYQCLLTMLKCDALKKAFTLFG